MTSSCDTQIERGLDAMLIVYSLLNDHPASAVCEQFIRAHSGWFTITLTIFEAKAVLAKVYGVDSGTALAAMNKADAMGIDLTDAVLLQISQAQGILHLATDDVKLAQACRQVGITPETPIDAALRQRTASWKPLTCRGKVCRGCCVGFING